MMQLKSLKNHYGVLETFATPFLFNNIFKMLDFPTLDLPINAISNNFVFGQLSTSHHLKQLIQQWKSWSSYRNLRPKIII